MRILMKHLTSILAGLCISPFSHAAEQAPIPTGHHSLSGASNYLLYNSCKPLENPKAIITLTTEMNAGAGGFDFQFNANSLATEQNPHGANADDTPSSMGWQQYIINVRAGKEKNTTDVSGFLEPWPSSKQDESNGSDLINRGGYHLVTLADTPTPTLPAGTKLEILLNTAPNDHSVTGITFEATLPGGAKTIVLYPKSDYWNGKTIELEGLALDRTLCLGDAKHPYNDKRFCPDVKKGARHLEKTDLTPVSSFQLNFACPWCNKGEGAIEANELEGFSGGLICLTGGDEGPLAHTLRSGGKQAARKYLEQLCVLFGRDNVYVELQRHFSIEEERRNQAAIELARSLHLPLLATNGVCHALPAQREILDVFSCLRHL